MCRVYTWTLICIYRICLLLYISSSYYPSITSNIVLTQFSSLVRTNRASKFQPSLLITTCQLPSGLWRASFAYCNIICSSRLRLARPSGFPSLRIGGDLDLPNKSLWVKTGRIKSELFLLCFTFLKFERTGQSLLVTFTFRTQ